MKIFTTVFITGLLSLLLPLAVFGQSSQGPFDDLVGKEIQSDNIFMLWQETGGSTISFQKIIKYDMENDRLDIQDDVARGFANKEVGGSRQMVAVSGNLNNDLYDDVVAAWEGLNGTIELYIPKFDSTEAMWNDDVSHTTESPITSEIHYLQGRILLEATDLNNSGTDEIILLYKGDDDNMHLEVYSTNEALEPVMLDSISVSEVADLSFTYNPAALTIADLDGDGTNEIVIATVAPNSWEDGRWSISIKRYELNESNELILASENFDFPDPASSITYNNLRYTLGAGKLSEQGKDDLLFAWSFDNTNPTANDTFLYLSTFNPETNLFSRNDRIEYEIAKSSGEMNPMVIKTGDLDDDGLDEVVFAAEGSHHVLDINESLDFEEKFQVGQNPSTFGMSYDYLEITDINQDGLDEFIIAINRTVSGNEYFQLRAFSAYDATDDEWLATPGNVGQILINEEIPEGSAGPRRYAIATGSFDGYAFTLGEPDYFQDAGDLQPLVILNAPPIHFDIFNDTEYDINTCFPANECEFQASYTTIADTSKSLKTKVGGDFAASVGVGGEGEITTAPMGVGASVSYEAYFDANFGAGFSNTDQEIQEITITASKNTSVDDQIFASVTNYDVWRYPVYHGTETTPQRYMVSVEPKDVQSAWFSTKSWNASKYIPNHEVGNILSYPSYSEITENPEVHKALNYFGNSITLESGSFDTWELNTASVAISEDDKNINVGYDMKANIGVVRASSSGSLEEISTHSSTIREGLVINVQLDKINLGYGEVRYEVTPYAYWNNDGALVVDYAAEPERSGQGGVQTWWEEFYAHDPDPAFILPWRYDPEKGMALSDEIRRFRTKDVFFDNYEPSSGDTLTITARVRNFSLMDSPPVPVTFYVGDPDAGGELIVGVDEESTITSADDIAAQRSTDVQVRWVVPSDLPQNPRIFAVLNEDAGFNEIHQNNNKGFNVLSPDDIITSNEEIVESTIPETFKLHQSYPNPFNPTTTIGYELPQQTDVKLEVFNILGQRIVTLVNETQTSGIHEVTFDASNLSSGVYLYRITTGQFTKSRKMLLVK